MRYSIILLVCLVLVLFLCSFAEPSTTNIYSGTLQGSGLFNGYHIVYYVNDSSHLCLSDGGYLINIDRYTISGMGKINNYEFPIMFSPDSGLQILDGGNWVQYNLIPTVVPSHFPFPVWIGFLGLILILLALVYFILRGFAV